jgi:hypothetical protein
MNKGRQVTELQVEGIHVELRQKRIRSLRISVHPPEGEVRVSAPFWMSESRILSAILEKKDWILEAKKRWAGVFVLPKIQALDGEVLQLQEESLVLRVHERESARSSLQRIGNELHLSVSKGSSQLSRQKRIELWYRNQFESLLPEILEFWSQKLGVEYQTFQIKKMKSRWGSCHTKSKKITLNLELMRCKSIALHYVVLHELAHLIEPSHNARFKGILDQHLPDWREIQKSLPVHL